MEADRQICANCGQPIGELEPRVQRSTDLVTVHEHCPQPEREASGAPDTALGNNGEGRAD